MARGWIAFAIVLLGLLEARSGAQSSSSPTMPPSRMPDMTSETRGGRVERDPFREKQEKDREKLRNVERQKRMVVEAERLLLLASELKATAAKTGELSEVDTKKLEEIEKLARSVKTRMKD